MPTDFAPWSLSKAKIAKDCALRFHWKYVNKVPGKWVESSAGRMGSAVHQIIERMLIGHEYDVAFKQAAIDAKLTRPEMLELSTFKDPIHRFLERFLQFCDKNGVERDAIMVEQDLLVHRDLSPGFHFWNDPDLWIRGAADVAVPVPKQGQPYMIIVDHKTGEPRDIDEYLDQLKFYAVMSVGMFPEIAGAQAVIHWPRAEDPKDVFAWGPMWSREYILDTLYPWVEEYLDDAEARGKAKPVPTEGWYCEYCEFRHRCPLQGK